MKKKVFLSGLTMVLLLGGCAKAAGGAAADTAAEHTGSGTAEMEFMPEEYEAAAAEESKEAENNETVTADPAQFQEKLVYRGGLSIESLTYDETLTSIRSKIRENGGIIENENESDDGYRWYAEDYQSNRNLTLTVRIPTENYEAFLAGMEGTGKIISRYSNVENITRRYNDTTVQIEALKQQEERLLDMMKKAETVEDMILVETRLTEVQTDLNLLQTDLNAMNTDIKYSTVTITLREVHEYTSYEPTFFERIGRAFVQGWENFLDLAEGIIVLAVMFWPVIAAAAVLITVFTARRRKRRAAKEAEKAETKEIL